jgi:hypothetical protein
MEQAIIALVAEPQAKEIPMKPLTMIGLATVLAIGSATAADARQGCGTGFHRNMHGHCVPNGRARVYVVGSYYPGRGYWYNGRWWHSRYRYHHGWRYR